jgi:hypothetical protein
MRADTLLRLFPRAWRERYGDEFLATIGEERLSLTQVIDITAGAVDAWFSPEVRRATRAAHVQTTSKETLMVKRLMTSCGSTDAVITRRDAWIGAGVLIGTTLLFTTLGLVAKRAGVQWAGDMLLAMSLPASVLASMPFTYLKGKSWRAQLLFIGLPMLILVLISLFASRI